MLYTSTRSKTDHYTANRALLEDRAPDGGFYIPFRLPTLSHDQLEQIRNQSFGETVAQILNLFFSTGISGWDVDCCIGKNPINIQPMSHRLILNELWHNPQADYGYIRHMLYQKLCGGQTFEKVSNWADVAIRIAVIFGVYAMIGKAGIGEFDVCVNLADFNGPMALWYSRKMGAPINTIICASNENSASWDLIHRGEMNMGVGTVHTQLPELDVSVPAGLERLLFTIFGFEDAAKFVSSMECKGFYKLRSDMLSMLNEGMFVSVVGKERIDSVINSTYRSNHYILDPYTAVSLGSLQDYRAKTGESRTTVFFCEKSPALFTAMVSKATGLSKDEILQRIH